MANIKQGESANYFMQTVFNEFNNELKTELEEILTISSFKDRYEKINLEYQSNRDNFFNNNNNNVYFHNITLNKESKFFSEQEISFFEEYEVTVKKLPQLGINNSFLTSISSDLNKCHSFLNAITYNHNKYIKNKDICAQMSLFIAPEMYKLISANKGFFYDSIRAFFMLPDDVSIFISTLMFLKKPGAVTSLFHRDDVMAEEERLYNNITEFTNSKQIAFNLALTNTDEHSAPLHIFSAEKLDAHRFVPHREVVKYIFENTNYPIQDILKYLAVCEEANFRDNTYARVVGCHGINNIFNYYHYNKDVYGAFAETEPGYGFFFDSISAFHASTPNYSSNNRETISIRIEAVESTNGINPSGFPENMDDIVKIISTLYGINIEELRDMFHLTDGKVKYNCVLLDQEKDNESSSCITLSSLSKFYYHPRVQLYINNELSLDNRWNYIKENLHSILRSEEKSSGDICKAYSLQHDDVNDQCSALNPFLEDISSHVNND